MEESTDTTVFTQWDVFCVHNTALRMRFSKQNQWGSMTAKFISLFGGEAAEKVIKLYPFKCLVASKNSGVNNCVID